MKANRAALQEFFVCLLSILLILQPLSAIAQESRSATSTGEIRHELQSNPHPQQSASSPVIKIAPASTAVTTSPRVPAIAPNALNAVVQAGAPQTQVQNQLQQLQTAQQASLTNGSTPVSSLPTGAKLGIRTAATVKTIQKLTQLALPAQLGLPAADSTDPYIVAQAQALGNNVNQIFAFVRDQIGFDVYQGSVRGARGTLWSKAGNSLDKASLLIALLGASGIQAQYVQGTITSAQKQQLILSMFPTYTQLLGCPQNTFLNPVQTDSTLAFDLANHFWVEYGSGNTVLDPSFAGAVSGQVFGTPVTTFQTVPAALRQQVTLRLNAEIYQQASAALVPGGTGLSTTTVLQQTFNTDTLAGKPISVGNLVNMAGQSALVISSTTITYSPYFLLGQGGTDITQDPIIFGQDYQEVFTNFPLGSQVLTGLFLEVDTQNPNLDNQTVYPAPPSTVTYARTIFDRIGFAARQGFATANVTVPSPPKEAISNADIVTVNVLPGLQSVQAFQNQQTRIGNINQQIQSIQAQVQALPSTNLTTAQQQLLAQSDFLTRLSLIAMDELITMGFDGASDTSLTQLEQEYVGRGYYTTPRLTLGISSFANNAVGFKLDLLKNDIRFEASPQQIYSPPSFSPPHVSTSFEIQRGLIESSIEDIILAQITGQPAIGIDQVIQALPAGESLLVFGAPNIDDIASTTLTPDVQARIRVTIANGEIVFVPSHMVTINGQTTVGWYEADPTTGHLVSTFPDGGHQALVTSTSVSIFTSYYQGVLVQLIGYIEGYGVAGYVFAAAVVTAVAGGSFVATVKQGKTNGNLVGNLILALIKKILSGYTPFGIALGVKFNIPKTGSLLLNLIAGFSAGFNDALKVMAGNTKLDPEAYPFISSPLGPAPASITPSSSPGANLALNPDTLLTTPVSGMEVPTNYQLQIQNTGPTDTFSISGYANYSRVTPTTSSITIPGGQTATIGVCVVPASNSPLPPPGTADTVNISVYNRSFIVQKSISSSLSEPSIPGVELLPTQTDFTLAPGTSTPLTISLNSTGNAAPGTVTLAISAPSGITLAGLPTSASLALGQVIPENVTLSAATGTAPGVYTVTVSATLGSGASAVLAASLELEVQVATVGTCTGNAGNAATGAEKGTLAAALNQLSLDETAAIQKPSDPAGIPRINADLAVVIRALDANYLQSYVTQLQAVQPTLASATAATLPNILSTLDAIFCTMKTTLASAQTEGFSFYLQGNQSVASVTNPAVFSIFLGLSSGQTQLYRTFDLSVSGLPAGVTANLSKNRVQLSPNNPDDYSETVTLFMNPSQLVPFTFTVTATPEDGPAFARSSTGSVTVAPELVNIDDIVITDTNTGVQGVVATAGDIIDVKARISGVVNQSHAGFFDMALTQGPPTTSGGESGAFSLTTTSPSQTVDVGTINTSGLPQGVWKVYLSAQDYNYKYLTTTPAVGYFIVGAPISATLTAMPSVVTAPAASITTTLTLSRDQLPNLDSTLLGSATVSGQPHQVVLNGTDAYVCSSSQITRINISNPASPTVLNSFASDATVLGSSSSGYGDTPCAISPDGKTLYLQYSRPVGSHAFQLPTNLAVYDISTPSAPVLKGTLGINYPDAEGLAIVGTKAFTTTQDIFYCPICGDAISQQNGNYLVFDVSTPTSPSFTGDLFPTAPNNGYVYGGPNSIFGFAQLSATTALLTSSTSTGSGVGTGVGNLLTVSTSTPATPAVTAQTQIPGTRYINSIAVQGNFALVSGDTAGYYNADSGFTGKLTLTLLDITNPAAPAILQTLVTGLGDPGGASLVSLGNFTFAAGGATNGGQNVMLFIDASQFDPSKHNTSPALRYTPYNVPSATYPSASSGTTFYATTPTGISIYRLGQVLGPQLNVTLQVPTGTGVTASNFNPVPTQTTPGTGTTTYFWQQPSTNSITFTESLTGMQPGIPVTVVSGGSIDFVAEAFGNGSLGVAPLDVLPGQILSISPDSQSVTAGQSTSFTITVSNPTAASITYAMSVKGVPTSWVQIPASVNIAAKGSQNVTLTVTPDLAMSLGNSPSFTVVAIGGSLSGTVVGNLSIGGDNGQTGLPGTYSLQTAALAISASPITIGQGQTVPVNALLQNAGSEALSPNVSFSASTFHITGSASQQLQIGPAATKQVSFSLTSDTSTPLGAATAYINAIDYYANPPLNQTFNIPVTVVGNGVTAAISGLGTTASPYVLAVKNIGNVKDTYSLTPTGVLGGITTLGVTSVTLNPGQSQNVSITLGGFSGLASGTVNLTITAVSKANSAVYATASTPITIGQNLSVTSSITPIQAQVNGTPAALYLKLTNNGNVDDTYSAAITGVTNGVVATLSSSNGTSVQSIPDVRISAGGVAQIPMTGTIPTGSGKVTTTVTSLTNSSVNSVAQATITGGATVNSPTASAGTSANIPLHHSAVLDGTGSADGNSPALPLTYAWTLASAPAGSTVTTGAIRQFANYPRAAFTPDVAGSYVFNLAVSNGQKSASASVTMIAEYMPPVAVTGKTQNAKAGNFVFLNGKDSYDPEDAPITFAWSFVTVPSASKLTTAALNENNTPKPYFQPDVAGTYTVQLVVADSQGSSAPSTVTITAVTGNVPPNANAGYPQNTETGRLVTLNGTLSNSPPNGALPLTYSWSFTQVPFGSALTSSSLSNATSATPSFTPDVAGSYQLLLTVTDSQGSASDGVTVTAFSHFSPPNAVTETLADSLLHALATFDGTGSNDPDTTPAALTYAWSIVTEPATSTATISQATQSAPQFTPDVPGYYVLQLEVSDGVDTSDRNFLLLAANACDADGNGIVNPSDLSLILAAEGAAALANDPRDPLHAGQVTAADYTHCHSNLTQYQLSYTLAGTGTGSVQPPAGPEPTGTPITLTAVPGTCSVFSGFSSNVVNDSITLTGAATVTATFEDDTAKQVGILPAGGAASGQVLVKVVANRRVTNTNNWVRMYSLQNTGAALTNVYLALDPAYTNVTGLNTSIGTTVCTSPRGSAYVALPNLPANSTTSFTLQVITPNPLVQWNGSVRILAGGKP